MRATRVLGPVLMTAVAAVWAANCGGDGGTGPDPTPQPPPNRAPVAVGSLEILTMDVGGEVTVNVASSFSDPDGDALTYAASTSDAAVAGASVSGSNVAVTGEGAGTATITVTATDTGGLSATQTMGVTVQAVNHPPTVVGGIDNQMLSPGDTVTADVADFFEDPEGDELTFTAASSDTAVATASLGGSSLTVVAVAGGSATVRITATDTADNSNAFEFTVTVEGPNLGPEAVDTIPAQTVVTGDSATVDVAAFFADPNNDSLTYTAATSDASVATASVSGSVVTIAAVGAGTATVTVTASDPDGLSADQEIGVTVPGPRAVGTIDAVSLKVGGDVTIDVAANFDDPDGDALTYAAESSDTAVATASISGNEVTVTAVAVGTASVTVTASDPDGLSATQTVGVTVSENSPPTVTGMLDDRTVTAGDTITADVAGLFEDPEGDELTFGASSSDTTVATASVDGSALTVLAVGEGSATVTVRAMDTAGNSTGFDFTVTVELPNRAPEITDTIRARTLMVGDTVRFDPSDHFADPDGDILTFEAVSSNTGFVTALIDADGMVEIGAQAPGSTVVTVTASDPEGLDAAQQVSVTVTTPPPAVADTIPTHDMIVDSMVPLDMSPYFEGGDLTYSVTSSDEMVAVASVDGSTVTTTGRGAVEDSISSAYLTVTATNAGGEVTQDSIMVRVHQEPYDSLPGLSVDEEGVLTAELPGGASFTLSVCVSSTVTSSVAGFTIYWTEWQRAVGGGWVTVQNNVFVSPQTNQQVHVCPINIEDEKFPPGIYRLA
ncbi:MAG: hypothetical protein OXN18_15375, partial [Gemmatimonadota bacterium]|nr:hypothetical protein [Gemmatimonadota bacterium]